MKTRAAIGAAAPEEDLRKRDWPATHVQAGLKIAAILTAAAAVVRAEAGWR